MNRLTIIGNLTKDPELRSTPDGVSVCNFTVAVNKRNHREGEPEADYFKVTVWRERGENCAKWLRKGSKVCVIGAVSVTTYTANDGTTKAVMEIKEVTEVEFLSRPQEAPHESKEAEKAVDKQTGWTQAQLTDLPF